MNHAFELRLDWEAGTSRVHGIYAHPGLIQTKGWQANLGGRHKQSPPPQQAIHYAGRQYMSNTFNAAPAGGGSVSALWIMEDGVIRPVAADALEQAEAYRQNKATGLLSDVPGEARLRPSAWGEWTLQE